MFLEYDKNSITQKKSRSNLKTPLFRFEKMLYTKRQCEENFTISYGKIKEKDGLKHVIIGIMESTGI